MVEYLRKTTRFSNGDPGWIRTNDSEIRNLVLYPLSYRTTAEYGHSYTILTVWLLFIFHGIVIFCVFKEYHMYCLRMSVVLLKRYRTFAKWVLLNSYH